MNSINQFKKIFYEIFVYNEICKGYKNGILKIVELFSYNIKNNEIVFMF